MGCHGNDIRESVSGNKVAYTPDGERVPELLALQSALKNTTRTSLLTAVLLAF